MRIRSVFRSKSIAKNWFREIHHSVCGFLSFSSQTAGESKGEESVATALFAYYGQQKIVAGEKRETVEAQIKTLDNLKQLLGQLISDVANNLRVITNSEKRFDGVLPGTVISVDLETRRERLSIYRSILTTVSYLNNIYDNKLNSNQLIDEEK